MGRLDDLLAADAAARAAGARAAARRALAVLAGCGVEARLVGSLARGDHRLHSDVDLLVLRCPDGLRYGIEGLVEEALEGLPFDVIYLDEVARRSRPRRSVHPIFVDVRQDLEAARVEAAMVESARVRCAAVLAGPEDPVERWIHVTAVASGIEKVYGGIERGLARIVRDIDRHVPGGADRHATLLRRLAGPVPGRRPAVLSAAAVRSLDGLRAFRRRERNSYVADLDPRRVLEVPAAVAAVASDLDRFEDAFDPPPA